MTGASERVESYRLYFKNIGKKVKNQRRKEKLKQIYKKK